MLSLRISVTVLVATLSVAVTEWSWTHPLIITGTLLSVAIVSVLWRSLRAVGTSPQMMASEGISHIAVVIAATIPNSVIGIIAATTIGIGIVSQLSSVIWLLCNYGYVAKLLEKQTCQASR